MTWRERIQAARERGTFLQEEMCDVSSWTTCAVGEQRKKLGLKRDPHSQLFKLGVDFAVAVQRNSFASADSLLDRIEATALQLKSERVS